MFNDASICKICASAIWHSLGNRGMTPVACEFEHRKLFGRVLLPAQCTEYATRKDWPRPGNGSQTA